jgi:hypothetical protein
MWKFGIITILLVSQVGCTDNGISPDETAGNREGLADCLAENYVAYTYSGPNTIPDGDPTGITLGPLRVSQRHPTIQGILLSLGLNHEYAGDLSIRLQYDGDNDGACDAESLVELYLARLDPCEGEQLWAYHVSPHGEYFFKDEGCQAAGEEASFEVFEGLAGGGSFYLSVVDGGTERTGTIEDWVVYVRK